MVLAAALISFAIIVPPAEPQSAASDSSAPYSLEGVRQASAGHNGPTIDPASVERRGSGYRLAVESPRVTTDPCARTITACQMTWATTALPTWNDQFLGMTGPPAGMGFNSMATNGDRIVGAATSVGFALAVQGVLKLVNRAVVNSRQSKVSKVRSEIEAELTELERLNKEARQPATAPKR